MTDAATAASLATAAGRLLMSYRRSARDLDPRELGRNADRRAQNVLAAELAAECPGDAILSEEALDDRSRLDADRVWILDPLDGTREYSEGRDDWAVHVALWSDGELTAGAVALPPLEVTYDSATAPSPPPRAEGQQLRLAVSRSRAPTFVDALAAEVDAELVPMGSAGAKAMAVVRGEVDAYVHAGGIHEWDTAAPVVVARGAGLHASRLDGSPLAYNRPQPLQDDLVICRTELCDVLLPLLRRYA